jgi:predicted component of type VI protein secretion system
VKKHIITRLGLPPIELEPGVVFTIGRDPESKLAIPVDRVSRHHAEIRWKDEKPLLVDLGSSNGTFVGGRQIVEHPLAAGDEIQIGPFVAVYQYGDPADAKKSSPSLTGRLTRTVGAQTATLTGVIDKNGLGEMLQGLELNAKTGTLSVYDRGFHAWLTVQNGAPAVAEAGTKQDREALFDILALTEGRFIFEEDLKTADKRLSTTITAILLEWSRRQQSSAPPSAPPPA